MQRQAIIKMLVLRIKLIYQKRAKIKSHTPAYVRLVQTISANKSPSSQRISPTEKRQAKDTTHQQKKQMKHIINMTGTKRLFLLSFMKSEAKEIICAANQILEKRQMTITNTIKATTQLMIAIHLNSLASSSLFTLCSRIYWY